MSRPDRPTWIGFSKAGRFAVLLNYHEPVSGTGVSPLSRGMFPREFLDAEDKGTEEWIREAEARYGESMKLTGGFTMLCGTVGNGGIGSFGILTNRAEHAGEGLPVFKGTSKGDSSETRSDLDIRNETIAISNSAVTEPWPKVRLGVQALNEVMDKVPETEADLITQLFGVLSRDTFPYEEARHVANATEAFVHLRKSIFIPSLKVELPGGKTSTYGTRTQTVVLVHKSGKVKYIERTLYNGKTFEKDLQEQVFDFNLKDST